MMPAIKKIGLCLALTSALAFSASCTPIKKTRGNIIQDYQLADVQTGEDSRSDVLNKIGSPTTIAPFDENVWYYMGQKTEKKGILDPEVVDERIIVLVFNDEGIVERIESAEGNRMDLPYVRRKTPTSGNEVTVMQQFIGNLGRFNTETPQQE